LSDADLDGDGKPDCVDLCPNDSLKSVPGICGCGKPDIDSDGDGKLDCLEACPNDPNKTAPGICGCGVPDVDSDTDGVMDCVDNCPNFYNPEQTDSDGDGVGDACQSQAGPTGRTTPTTTPPAYSLCGPGVAQTLAACSIGLLLMRLASRRAVTGRQRRQARR
jgi:hypothetical protein